MHEQIGVGLGGCRNYKRILTSALGVASMTAALHAQQRPNIVYIMADDLTYSDVGCYGGVNSITPP